MPIDKVAVSRERLKQAAEGGSLSNEAKFREEIKRLQGNIRDYTPSVIDISSSEERQFAADLVNLEALFTETTDAELGRLCGILLRSLRFLNRTKEDN
jgi:hypothetical protein